MNPTTPWILVLGEALVDRLPSGPVAAGASLNVARHLSQLGCQPLFISRIGRRDEDGRRVCQAMQSARLSLAGLQQDAEHPTGAVDVLMAPNGSHRFVIAADAAWDHLDLEQARAALPATPPALIYFSTLAQRHATSRHTLRALIDASPAPRFLDLNLRDGVTPELALDSLRRADWVKVNGEELDWLLAHAGLNDVPGLMREFALQHLVLTRGAAGYSCLDGAGQLLAEGAAAPLTHYADTVGAGDAFSACLLAAQLQGKALAPSLALANRFAAAICAEVGAAPADAEAFYPVWRAELSGLSA